MKKQNSNIKEQIHYCLDGNVTDLPGDGKGYKHAIDRIASLIEEEVEDRTKGRIFIKSWVLWIIITIICLLVPFLICIVFFQTTTILDLQWDKVEIWSQFQKVLFNINHKRY